MIDGEEFWKKVYKVAEKFCEIEAYCREDEVHKKPNINQKKMLLALTKNLQNNGVILADEVGMGKTLIAVILAKIVASCGGRVAVLSPKGIAHQWQKEFSECDLIQKNDKIPFIQNLQGLVSFDDENPHNWDNDQIVLLSHMLTNYRSTSHYVNLFPLMRGHWCSSKESLDDLRGFKKYKKLFPEISLFAKSCIDKLDKRKNYGPALAKTTELKNIFKAESYSKKFEDGYRKYLDECIGIALGNFDLIIIDEAHKNRNEKSNLSTLINIVKDNASEDYRVMAMTATPIELEKTQWEDILNRINAENIDDLIAKASDYIEKGEAVKELYLRHEYSIEKLNDFKKSADGFKKAFSPYFFRRTKNEEGAVKLYKEITHSDRDYDYQKLNKLEISPFEFSNEWQKAFCAIEAFSMLPVSNKLKIARLKIANGHGVYSLIESIIDNDSGEEDRTHNNEQNIQIDEKTQSRIDYWEKVICNVVPEEAEKAIALFNNPMINHIVAEIRKITDTGEKIFVVGTNTVPLRAINSLLNAHDILNDYINNYHNYDNISEEHEETELDIIKDDDAINIQSAIKHLLSSRSIEFEDIQKFLKKRNYQRKNTLEKIRNEVGNLNPKWIKEDKLIQNVAKALLEIFSDSALDCLSDKIKQLKKNYLTFDESEDEDIVCLESQDIERFGNILEEEYGKPKSKYSRMMYGKTKPNARKSAQIAFNRETSSLKVLIGQSQVVREGLNLHEACKHIMIIHPEWNPAVIEQQIGRIDRVGSYWEKQLYAQSDSKILPQIHVTFVLLKQTYDEHQWSVLEKRRAELRTQLHGEVLPFAETTISNKAMTFRKEVSKIIPSFSPSK